MLPAVCAAMLPVEGAAVHLAECGERSPAGDATLDATLPVKHAAAEPAMLPEPQLLFEPLLEPFPL